jgi:hypothetical protein
MRDGSERAVAGRAHGVVLRVIFQLLGRLRGAKEEGEVAEDVLARRRKRPRRGELCFVGGLSLCGVVGGDGRTRGGDGGAFRLPFDAPILSC